MIRWMSAIGGIAVTAAGAVVLAVVIQGAPADGGPVTAIPSPIAAPSLVAIGEPPANVDLQDIASSVTSIDGLDEATAGALDQLGYTERISETALRAQLPAAVVDALIGSGAVLIIEEVTP